MKLETFFEKFELFLDAPNAADKMRELILHLAVHGKLVEQFDGDEPAVDLLNRSRAEMARLMASGKAKKEKPAEPVSEEEITFSLPRGWAWCRLVDAGQFINGLAFKPSDWGSVGRPIIRIQNLSGRNLEFNRTAEDFDPSVLVQDGDILVSWSATLDAFIWRGEEGVLNQHIFRVLPAPLADKGYIFWLLKWVIRELAESDHAHGLVMSHINRGPFLAHPIPLPPLAEQKRIVAKIDELMALCDRLEAQQQDRNTCHSELARASLARFSEAPTPANVDFLFHQSYSITPADLRKSILTLAVQGKLVPHDSNDEPAGALVDRIRLENADRKRRGNLAPAADLRDLPFDLPNGWSVAELGSILAPNRGISYGVIKLGPEPQQGGIYVLRCSNVRFRKIDLNGIRKVTEELSLKYGRTILEGGEVLINVRGTLGGCAVVPQSMKGFNIAREVAVIPVHSEIDPTYLLNVVAAPYFQDKVEEGLRGIAYEGLNLGLLRDFLVPIPPRAEQRRIVAKVDQLMALVDQLESQLAEAKSKSTALLEAIVHELLNPSPEVIDLASYRAAIGCYTIRKMSKQPYFGRTAAMKTLYLAEAHVGLNLGFQPEREAAGPLDHWIYRFEDEGKQKAWFKASENTSNGKMKVEYQPDKMLAAQAALAESQLSQEQRKEFNRMLDLLSGKKTEEVEIIATLFAAWNDFLIDGHTPSDDEIVTEVRENWHVKKERFTPPVLRQWLGWLRQNNLVPQGRLPHTVHQSELSLS